MEKQQVFDFDKYDSVHMKGKCSKVKINLDFDNNLIVINIMPLKAKNKYIYNKEILLEKNNTYSLYIKFNEDYSEYVFKNLEIYSDIVESALDHKHETSSYVLNHYNDSFYYCKDI